MENIIVYESGELELKVSDNKLNKFSVVAKIATTVKKNSTVQKEGRR